MSDQQAQSVAGGDFVVTICHTVQLRVPDVGVIAEALQMSPLDALTEVAVAGGLGVAGLHRGALAALPADTFEIVRTDRVDTDVDRVETFAFTDGREWRMHVPAGDGESPGRPTTFVVTDAPLSETQTLAVRDLLRATALSNALPATTRGQQ